MIILNFVVQDKTTVLNCIFYDGNTNGFSIGLHKIAYFYEKYPGVDLFNN